MVPDFVNERPVQLSRPDTVERGRNHVFAPARQNVMTIHPQPIQLPHAIGIERARPSQSSIDTLCLETNGRPIVVTRDQPAPCARQDFLLSGGLSEQDSVDPLPVAAPRKQVPQLLDYVINGTGVMVPTGRRLNEKLNPYVALDGAHHAHRPLEDLCERSVPMGPRIRYDHGIALSVPTLGGTDIAVTTHATASWGNELSRRKHSGKHDRSGHEGQAPGRIWTPHTRGAGARRR